MRTAVHAAIAAAATVALLVPAPPAPAASLTQSINASANIAALAKLSLSPLLLVFPDADPELVPQIPSSSGPIAITAKARTSPGSEVTLTVLGSDDLRSGMDTIPIDALTWTATGAGFVGGTMSRSASQTVGTWMESGVRAGTQAFSLENTWGRATGTYTVSLVYTLTAP